MSTRSAQDFVAAERALSDPVGELSRLGGGELSPEAVQVLRERRPGLREQVRQEVRAALEELSVRAEEPSYRTLVQLSLVTGRPLTPTMDPAYVRAVQAVWARRRAERERPPPRPPSGPSQVDLRRRAAAEMSPSERLEAGAE